MCRTCATIAAMEKTVQTTPMSTVNPGGEPLESNVFKTALLFEGGSMRAAYTCAFAVKFLEEGLYFDHVYGVSAGSSNTVNYLSRDIWRTHASFTTFMGQPGVGNWRTFLQHKGIFNAHFIYQEAGLPTGVIPFDFDTLRRNPAKLTIVSVDRDTGEDLYFTKADMPALDDLMVRVRASSTIPALMPPPRVDGRWCYDGGFADGGGLPVRKIMADGFERMVVIRTRKRGYRKKPGGKWANVLFWRRPHMKRLVPQRTQRYNEACDLIDQLEAEGRALVIYADDITLTGSERDVALLEENYQAGYAQATRDFPKILAFVQAGEQQA